MWQLFGDGWMGGVATAGQETQISEYGRGRADGRDEGLALVLASDEFENPRVTAEVSNARSAWEEQ